MQDPLPHILVLFSLNKHLPPALPLCTLFYRKLGYALCLSSQSRLGKGAGAFDPYDRSDRDQQGLCLSWPACFKRGPTDTLRVLRMNLLLSILQYSAFERHLAFKEQARMFCPRCALRRDTKLGHCQHCQRRWARKARIVPSTFARTLLRN